MSLGRDGFAVAGFAEVQETFGVGVYENGVAFPELAGQDVLCQRVGQLTRDRPLERTRAIDWIVARYRQCLLGGIREGQRQLALRQTLPLAAATECSSTFSLMDENVETLLREVVIVGQNICDTQVAHSIHRNAVHQAVSFVSPALIEF
jgi:hypothetical protein